MASTPVRALCAALALGFVPLSASAAETAPAANPAAAKPAAAKPAATKRAGHSHRAAAERQPAAAPQAYDLVPSHAGSSALARARQNSFGTPDDEPSSSARPSRRVGIGLGAAGGVAPGLNFGF